MLKPHHVVTALLVLALIALMIHGGVPGRPSAGLEPGPVPVPAERGATPLAGEVWELDEVGARIAIPPGWSEAEVQGRRYLRRDCASPLEGNLNLIELPNLFGRDLDGLLAENVEELNENPSFALENARKLTICGREVLRIDYRGRPQGATEELHFAGLIYLRGRMQVVLTACARQAAWHEIEPWVESSLASLELAPAG